jgi:thiol:disulfide interchange protein
MLAGRKVLNGLAVVAIVWIVACHRGSEPAATTPRWEPSMSAALARASADRKPVMIDFYTDWCGWCKRLDRTTLADARVQRALERFVVVKLNAEKDGSPEADRFGVRGYPTVVFLDAAGKEIGRIPGYIEADGFLQELEDVLKKS